MIDVGELLGDPDFRTTVTLRRVTRTMSDGVARETSADSTITALVQPAKPDEVQLLPEGLRHDSAIVLFTRGEIRATPDAQDIIVYGGNSFLAAKSENWSPSGYYRTIATGFAP